MDPHYQQDPTTGTVRPSDDDAMTGMEENMSTTPTGAQNNGLHNAPQQQEQYQPSHGTFSPQPPFSPNSESDQNSRYPSANSGYQQQQYQQQPMQPQPYSRPSSGLSGQGDRQGYAQGQPQQDLGRPQSQVVLKVGMVGDAQIGKTSLMVKYVEGSWDEDYIQTLGTYDRRSTLADANNRNSGVNFMEKTISIRNTEITFSIWDLGGQREFVNMLPLVCNDAVAILFMFDLTRKSTLNSIKEWYRQGRGFNKTAIPFLIGTKYDHFINFSKEEQEEISTQVFYICFIARVMLISWYRPNGLQRLCVPVSSLVAQATASTYKRYLRSLILHHDIIALEVC